MIRKYTWYVLISMAVATVVSWLAYMRPWEKEVWITTTPDSFVVNAAESDQLAIETTKISVGITPAPWPEEAQEIMRAARRGQIVHITLVSKSATDKFDIIGVSVSGNLIVDVKSMSNSKRVNALLRHGEK
jgi:hypothetical protein